MKKLTTNKMSEWRKQKIEAGFRYFSVLASVDDYLALRKFWRNRKLSKKAEKPQFLKIKRKVVKKKKLPIWLSYP